MSRRYFPLFVDISCQKIVVIGGGQVAQRRIETLLSFGADLWVAAPEITERLKDLAKEESVGCGQLILICCLKSCRI